MSERMIRANEADLCVETFGDANDPAILLIGGGAASMDWWDTSFCERLAAGGRFVIRYDQRDTGRSVTYERGKPEYTFPDLAEDAVGVLDALGIDRAHVVGISMGGTVALGAVLGHPDRVRTLTLMSTSPAGPGSPDNGLPPVADHLLAQWNAPAAEPDWDDRQAVVEYMVADITPYLGPVRQPESELRALIGRVYDRSIDLGAASNHGALTGGVPLRHQLSAIAAPTLVVHGTADPLFPLPHAEAFVAEMPRARLLSLEGVGHEAPPPATWDTVVPALLEHTAG